MIPTIIISIITFILVSLSTILFPKIKIGGLVYDDVVEFYNASIDLAIQRAFAMYGIDVDEAKQLVGSGRLKILTGGMLPAFNAIAILDGVDLFSLKVLGELEYERCVYTTRIEFMAIKEEADNA